jgi:formylglycine-generating enzyme required for sulfatase activity
MRTTLLLPLSCAVLPLGAAAQSGRTTLLTAPVVLGQTAGFALGHPASIAGNIYALLLAAPSWPQAVPVSLTGVVVNGLLRLSANGLLVGAAGVLDTSGRSGVLPMPVPNDPLLVGFSFDVQGVDLDAAGVFTLADNDLEIVVAAPPLPSANMVAIAPGLFSMGSNSPTGNPYFSVSVERPVHAVTITQPFWMGRHEVTQAQYQAVMGSNPSYFQGASWPNAANRPVEQVTWFNALAYCDALTLQETAAGRLAVGYEYRLPTEAEWEYCCRAGTTTEFHYGTTLVCGQANFGYSFHTNSICSNPGGAPQTAVVGSYAANAWGLNDMHGNVWEWCLDSWYGNANYPVGPVSDPYVTSGNHRVIRGGGWGNTSHFCRSAFRGDVGIPSGSSSKLGFRVVCAPVLP